jgi:hypothetical protein
MSIRTLFPRSHVSPWRQFREYGTRFFIGYPRYSQGSRTLPQPGGQSRFDLVQLPDLLSDFADFLLESLANLGARLDVTLQLQEIPNLGQRKAQRLRLLNELQVFDIPLRIEPESAFAAAGPAEQLLFLVKANGVVGKPRCLHNLPDLHPLRQGRCLLTTGYTLEFTPESREPSEILSRLGI